MADFPEGWFVGYDAPGDAVGLENWAVVESPSTLRIPEAGVTMRIVDEPEVKWNFEVTRDPIWRNINEAFDRLGIKVYIFNDRVEIRGHIPTDVINIPREIDRPPRRGNYLFGKPN